MRILNVTVHQVGVTQSGEVRRRLPSSVLRGWRGLKNFLQVRVSNSAGRVVHRGSFDFCPNSFEPQRVNDKGPVTPTYPPFCFASPLTKGMVWGIDRGWAAHPFVFSGARARLRDGRPARARRPNGRRSRRPAT